jgi:predicted nucleic acid-binding protein
LVLPDTSVWIDYFRGVSNRHTDHLDFLPANEPVALGDLIFTEVLQGSRHEADFRKAQKSLGYLPFYQLGGYEISLQSARNFRELRAKGIGVRKTIDVIIGTACIEMNFELLHNDRDFDPLEKFLDCG